MKGVTAYQLEMLSAVLEGSPGVGPIDFDQLLAQLSWKPKKESAQFTIRACISKGLMEKTELQLRRGRLRVCYRTTEKGRSVLKEFEEAKKSVSPDPRGRKILVPGVDLEDPFLEKEVFE